MKNTALLLLSILLLTACQETLEDRCAREAREYTEKHCPTLITENMVMDSMTFDKTNRTIGYNYTVKGVIDDSTVINNNEPRKRLLEQVKNSPNLKLYKDAGYSFRYTYYSTKENGTKLFEATFRKSDYQ
jgi:ADP-ribose pyrophosphatase YjhB (NUDIX family)